MVTPSVTVSCRWRRRIPDFVPQPMGRETYVVDKDQLEQVFSPRPGMLAAVQAMAKGRGTPPGQGEASGGGGARRRMVSALTSVLLVAALAQTALSKG
jgi:hypothetical protein